MPDLQEAITRKIGPLPAWAWGVAVGGVWLAVKVLGGNGGSGASDITGGTPEIVGGASDYASGGYDDSGLSSTVSGLSTVVSNLSAGSAIQQQLTDALARLGTQKMQLEALKRKRDNINDLFRDKKISANQRQKRLDKVNADIASTKGSISTTNTLITDLRSQLAGIG